MKAERLRALEDPKRLWHVLPPPHPRAGLYSGSRPLMKAKIYALPPCPVPEEKRRGFVRALRARFRRYTALPVVGFGDAIYFPGQYPPGLREIALTPLPAKVYAGEDIVQLLFLEGPRPEVTYRDRRGEYQGQKGITLPKI